MSNTIEPGASARVRPGKKRYCQPRLARKRDEEGTLQCEWLEGDEIELSEGDVAIVVATTGVHAYVVLPLGAGWVEQGALEASDKR